MSVRIRIRDNGPYVVRGLEGLVDSSGQAFELDDEVVLCRCGHSGRKPFCDGTHRVQAFASAPRAAGEGS